MSATADFPDITDHTMANPESDAAAGGPDPDHVSAAGAARRALAQLGALLGAEPRGVSEVVPTTEGWRALVDMVEDRPAEEAVDGVTTYRVDLDDRGELVGYERTGHSPRDGAGPR